MGPWGSMLSINYADTTLDILTVSTSILHTLKPRILTKACYLSKIVGGSGFLAKNRVLQRSAYYRGAYYRGLTVLVNVAKAVMCLSDDAYLYLKYLAGVRIAGQKCV